MSWPDKHKTLEWDTNCRSKACRVPKKSITANWLTLNHCWIEGMSLHVLGISSIRGRREWTPD